MATGETSQYVNVILQIGCVYN
ncbi:MAG: hypothetical protein IKS48_01320 [Eubacterium sp.]|nr:hypothetical protein [Eubacterium sp.]